MSNLNDKILGCLAGTAIGSSMGAATENMSPEEIAKQFGKLDRLVPFVREGKIFRRPAGPTYQYHRDERDPGMTEDGVERQFLLTLAIVDKCGRITADDLARVWLQEIQPDKHFGYLIEPTDAMFYRLLAGGLPPAAAGQYSWWPGLGGFARSCYPVGIINAGRPDDAARDAMEVGRMFQPPHTFGLQWGAVVASAVAEALRPNATLDSVIEAATSHVAPEVRQSVLDDVELGHKATDWKDLQRLLQLKYGKVDHRFAHVTSGAAFAALVLAKGNAMDAIVASANSAIDTDDVAAIAGGIAGALEGTKNIPADWIETVNRGTRAHPRTLVRWTLQEQAAQLKTALRKSLQKARTQIDELGMD